MNNNFFVAPEELVQYFEDLKAFGEASLNRLSTLYEKIEKVESQTQRNLEAERLEKKSLWVTVLTSVDDVEERVDQLHFIYFKFFRQTLQKLLEKVDAEIFWIQRGITDDNTNVIRRVSLIWNTKVRGYISQEGNLNNPDSVKIPMALKDIWREIIGFENEFSVFKKKTF